MLKDAPNTPIPGSRISKESVPGSNRACRSQQIEPACHYNGDRRGDHVRGLGQLRQHSLFINDEIGILFHEPEIAGNASKRVDESVEKVACRVELARDEGGGESLRWMGTEDGRRVVFDAEPYAGFWKRLGVNLMRVLPIDSML